MRRRPPPKTRSHAGAVRDGGFSLVEALCALFVLSVGVVGITQGLTIAIEASREVGYQSVAQLLGVSRLETLRADGIYLEGEEEGDFGEEFPLFRWVERTSTTLVDGLYEIRVEIFLKDSRRPLYEVETLLFDEPFTTAFDRTEERRDRMDLRPRGNRRGGTP